MTGSRKITMQWAVSVCAIAVSCICTLTIPTKADAAVYKCTDANNNVSYNQLPCAVEEKAETVLSGKIKNNDNVDCRIANNFARQIATRMRSGESSGTVFDSYGGIDAIPSTAVGIISYVYSHKDNLETGSQRITALSAARCSAGSYGPTRCDDFPYNFISELGGCEQAVVNKTAVPPAPAPSDQTSKSVKEGTTQALGARTSANELAGPTDCKQDMQTQLNNLFEQMRSEQSTSKQGQLDSREKKLREKLTNC